MPKELVERFEKTMAKIPRKQSLGIDGDITLHSWGRDASSSFSLEAMAFTTCIFFT